MTIFLQASEKEIFFYFLFQHVLGSFARKSQDMTVGKEQIKAFFDNNNWNFEKQDK